MDILSVFARTAARDTSGSAPHKAISQSLSSAAEFSDPCFSELSVRTPSAYSLSTLKIATLHRHFNFFSISSTMLALPNLPRSNYLLSFPAANLVKAPVPS
jgi:hypothetical protein